MLKTKYIRRVLVATIFIMVVPFSFAAFTLTGTIGERAKSNKYSLKNISHYSKKSFSLSLLRTNLQNHGSLSISPQTKSEGSFIQIEKGNTTYIMPFNYKVKVPRFKTPSPNN